MERNWEWNYHAGMGENDSQKTIPEELYCSTAGCRVLFSAD